MQSTCILGVVGSALLEASIGPLWIEIPGLAAARGQKCSDETTTLPIVCCSQKTDMNDEMATDAQEVWIYGRNATVAPQLTEVCGADLCFI